MKYDNKRGNGIRLDIIYYIMKYDNTKWNKIRQNNIN